MHLVELPHLAISSPAQIAVAGVLQIHPGNLLETTRGIEAGSELVGERLLANKVVCAGRADGLFVEAFGLEPPALEPINLGAGHRRAILETILAIHPPELD